MGVRRGKKRAFPPKEIAKIFKNIKLAAQFRLIDLVLAMAVYFPVCHSHRTEARSTALGSQGLTVHSCPLLCVAKLGNGFFCC